MRWPICRWVRSSSKRRRSTSRSRGVSVRSSWARVARSSARPKPCSVLASVSPSVSPALVLAGARGLQRHGAVRAAGPQGLEHLLLGGRGGVRDLRHGGLAVQVAGQLGHLLVHAQRQLLQATGHAHRPRAVAEVAPDFAQDGRHGVAGERDVAAEVEAIDRLDEPQTGDLEEIVEGLPAPLVAARQPAREGQEALHEPVTVDRVAPLHVALKQRPVGAQAPRVISSRAQSGNLSYPSWGSPSSPQPKVPAGRWTGGRSSLLSHHARRADTTGVMRADRAAAPGALIYGLSGRTSPNSAVPPPADVEARRRATP